MNSAKLVWLRPDGSLTCGHTTQGNGRAGDAGEWWCELCVLGAMAALDQDVAEAQERALRPPP